MSMRLLIINYHHGILRLLLHRGENGIELEACLGPGFEKLRPWEEGSLLAVTFKSPKNSTVWPSMAPGMAGKWILKSALIWI